MNRDNKQELVTEMHERLARAKAVFLADFRGMDVGKATSLRNELRSASVEYRVFKNTLLERASQGTDMECLSPYLTGPTAIAISYDDPVGAAKVLSKFAQDPQGKFVLKVGVLSGKLLDVKQIQALADLLKGNVPALVEALIKAKPSAAKGTYIKKITVSSTMGPGINLDISNVTSQI